MSVATFASLAGGQPCSYLALGGAYRTRRRNHLGSSPGPRYRLQVRIAPRACGLLDLLLQLEGADAVAVGGLVTRVDPVGERLDQAHQRRVGADIRRAVG